MSYCYQSIVLEVCEYFYVFYFKWTLKKLLVYKCIIIIFAYIVIRCSCLFICLFEGNIVKTFSVTHGLKRRKQLKNMYNISIVITNCGLVRLRILSLRLSAIPVSTGPLLNIYLYFKL